MKCYLVITIRRTRFVSLGIGLVAVWYFGLVQSATFPKPVPASAGACDGAPITAALQIKSYTSTRNTHGELCTSSGIRYRRAGYGTTILTRYSKTGGSYVWGRYSYTPMSVVCNNNGTGSTVYLPQYPNDPCSDAYITQTGGSIVNAWSGVPTIPDSVSCSLIPNYSSWTPITSSDTVKVICGTEYTYSSSTYQNGPERVVVTTTPNNTYGDAHTIDIVFQETLACISKLQGESSGGLGSCDQANTVGLPQTSVSTSTGGDSVNHTQAKWRIKVTGHSSGSRYKLLLNWEDSTKIAGKTTIKTLIETRAGIKAPATTPWCYPSADGEVLSTRIKKAPGNNGGSVRKLISYSFAKE